MAITGKFVADFASFQDAVQKATVSLVGMETGAGKVSTSLNKMVDQFSGRKIIQDAELMSQAFERLAQAGIGLTNAELQRMGRVADEAIAKLKAGGQEVPPGMQKIADAAKNIKPQLDQASSGMDRMFTTLKSIGGVLGIAFSAQALVGFVGSVFTAASSVKDLSDRLGVSTDAVQRFKFAAEQGGGSIDDVGASIAKMNDNLATGSKETYEAIKLLGLSFDAVRRQSPEDAFLGITDALKNIEDPMLRTRLQMDLFGKASAGIGAQIASGFREASDAADIMSAQTIKDLEAAHQAWENLGNKVVIVSGNIIASTMRTVSQATKSWQDFLVFVSNATTMGVGAAAALASATAEAARAAQAIDSVSSGGALTRQAAMAAGFAATKVEMAAAAEAAKQLKSAMDAAAQAGVKSYKDHQKHLKDMADQTEAVNLQMHILVKDRLSELGTRGVLHLRSTSDEAVRLGLALSGNMPVVAGLGREFEHVGAKVQVVVPKLETFKLNMSDLSRAMAELATVSTGSFGAMASGFASLINAANAASKAIDNIKAGSKAGFSMDGILGMATGIMGVVTAAATAINAIKQLWSVFDRNKGRDAVEDFAESFGGFDALHNKLLELGDAGEALWVKLTQGVGRNNPEQAAKVIAEVEAALARQAEAQDDVTGATEEQAQATIETASQAAKALDELTPRLKANEDEWRSWGDVVTAQIQKIADGMRGLQMPSPSGGGGALPSAAAISQASAVQSQSTVIVHSYIDGREAAQGVAPYIPGVVQSYGLA